MPATHLACAAHGTTFTAMASHSRQKLTSRIETEGVKEDPAWKGAANLACYSATKGAVRLFAKSLALECATARDNIRVNSVHPGIIDTPIWTKLPPGANAPLDPHKVAEMSVPLGVAGQAEDIANGVLFLCSDASRHMTGSELVIDGGMTAGRVGRLGG